jgi:hypothetical protein
LAQHGVVDAALVAEPDHGSTPAGDHCLPQSGVVVMVAQRRPAVGVVALRLQDLKVPAGLPRQFVDHVRVGSQPAPAFAGQSRQSSNGSRSAAAPADDGGGRSTALVWVLVGPAALVLLIAGGFYVRRQSKRP